jgi:glycosyltransferase involved in cell wall biosynthesis
LPSGALRLVQEVEMSSSLRESLLLIFPEVPYPARENGISIRYTPIIERLHVKYDIHLALILRPGVRFCSDDYFSGMCKSISVHQRQSFSVSLLSRIFTRLLKCFPVGVPYQSYYYDNREIDRFLKGVLSEKYDRVVWVSSAYLEFGFRYLNPQRISVDAIDSMYSHFIRDHQKSIFYPIDRFLVHRWERSIIKKTKLISYVSPADVLRYKKDFILGGKVHLIPNGVYLKDFPGGVNSGLTSASERSLRIGFLGNMGYQPNILAALRLKRIYDRLRLRFPDIKLSIIGRGPADEINELAKEDGVYVTGTVESIWSYVAEVDVFVFPMVSGAGQQNKMLEAMIAKRAVVANSLANSGVAAAPRSDFLIAESDDDFVEAVAVLLSDFTKREEVALAGYNFIRDRYDWDNIVPRLQSLWFE